jgi:transposase
MFVEAPAVYLHREPVDFRKSINGLAAIVEGEMQRSAFSGAPFVFCNRARDKLKLLYWDQSGFALWYKRLEQAKFHWPRRDRQAVIELSEQQFQWLLAGYDIARLQPHAPVQYSRVL